MWQPTELLEKFFAVSEGVLLVIEWSWEKKKKLKKYFHFYCKKKKMTSTKELIKQPSIFLSNFVSAK